LALTYTEPSDPSTLVPAELARELQQTVERGFKALCSLPEPLASRPLGADKWCVKQVIGHLIDSAANNHQRFVRLQIEPELRLPGYRQEEWVRVQCYDRMPWMQTLETWRVMNLYLVHVVRHIDPAHLHRVWHSAGEPLALGFIIEDYIAHMRHHLRQLPDYSG